MKKRIHWTQTPEGKAKLAERRRSNGDRPPYPFPRQPQTVPTEVAILAGSVDPPTDQELNIADAQRMLRAATVLREIGITEHKYVVWADELVKDATRLLDSRATAPRF